MRVLAAGMVALFLATSLCAQAQDVGLTMDGGVLPVLYGQSCGPLACTPFPGGTVAPGDVRVVTHHAAQNTPFVLAIGLPGPCLQFPGLDNSLLLAPPPATLAIGVVTTPGLTSACRQGQVRYQLIVPPAPSGLVFRLQSLGVSNSGALAFGPAIEATVQ